MADLQAFYSFRHTLDYKVALLRNRIAWIDYHKGQNELFVQDLPDGERRCLLTSEGDDGQPLRLVQIAPSGQHLLITRGEFTEDAPCQNPRQSVLPPSGQLQVIDLDSGSPLLSLGEFTTATLTPDDRAVLWAEKGTVYIQNLYERTPRILFSVRGQVISLDWSPDGQHLAFICQRQERTLLGLFTLGSSRIQWVSPGFDRDMSPCWSPNSRYITFLRFLGPAMDVAERLFSNQADSFAIMLADLESNIVQTIWDTGQEEHAGLSLEYGNRPLTWLDNDRLLFSHDNCGWDHIYLFELENNQGFAVTDGSWLVQDYAASRDGQWLAYSHNRRARHHYALDLMDMDSGKKVELPFDIQACDTKSSTNQYWKPAISGDSAYLVFMSGSKTAPCHLNYLDLATQTSHRLTAEDNYPQHITSHFITPVKEVIKSRDAQVLYSQVFEPEGQGPFPAIINIHGGPWVQSLPGFHPELGMSFQYAFCQLLASSGYLVLDINYRGGSGYGKLFRQAEERGWEGASDYLDVQAAAQWLSRHNNVDRSRIGVIGESWGGYLSAMALAKDSTLFRAGVVINGCHSFPRELRRSHWGSTLFSCLEGETATEAIARAKIAEESSPWGWLDQWMSPVLIVHGDDDRTVSFEESQHLAHALQMRSVKVESLALPDEAHSFLLHESWLRIGNRVLKFLGKNLKG
ncbi:S9 family peptidase [Parendozoicomonas haliclonae]|uniref:Acyl-peptide hydrolase n=1 Tax=Parendozoicomonas haliclonae TaxID=1960125 RepID=A0A1X7AE28_9GAMM|nr:prolyl oligopeptidase family serine peptidase [Parendozoicomonas haliclonae]SMA32053.1 Prolyl tripeptidyl peptidase precursor [Parendozoicomonas haliclonae]